MQYILGIITGILLCAFLIAVDLIFKRQVNSGGINAKITQKSNQKAAIVEPPSEELESFISSLPKE